MPKLLRLTRAAAGGEPAADIAIDRAVDCAFEWADDPFAALADDEAPGGNVGDVMISLGRFRCDGEAFQAQGRRVGVRLRSDEAVEDLAPDLARVCAVALEFPKFRDGRAFSSAALLRERYGYAGEVRAVGEVLRDQARDMVRVGFDSFEPADGSTPEAWAASALRMRHVYQRSADGRPPAWRERADRL